MASISDIYMWPVRGYDLFTSTKAGDKKEGLIMLALAGGVMYYVIGGSPLQGQDTMLLAQGYLAGGAAAYAYDAYVVSK